MDYAWSMPAQSIWDRSKTQGVIPSSLGVSAYERTAAAIIAGLILVGFVVALLLIMWSTHRMIVPPRAIEAELIEPLAGGGNSLGEGLDLLDPGSEEQIDDLDPSPLPETLLAVTDVATSVAASWDERSASKRLPSRGSGTGRSNVPGPGNADLIPRWDRWQLQFNDTSLQEYARQLDFFEIELAAIGGGRSQVDYAYRLSQPRPAHRVGNADDRISFRWSRDNELQAADAELLQRAGIPTAGRVILKFLPTAAENHCARLEDQELKRRGWKLEHVRSTRFQIVPAGDGYSMVLVGMTRRG